ncbi:hypothetical protein AVANI_40 [Mycobacterium phage Avani]|nr:hypothetical protein N850_gp042 [Mycobacterium phage Jabbawokkie]YP_009013135.1 hypothetical protein CL78_gp040 [Mycobacterium phage Avani]YP_009963739.1 hypothetical protein I5I02_gp041 [Mycobacterium phage Demsculpinboyz]YP_009963959.1 hypothetical protein I5I04_gp042 [Mycobacterium phage Zapner]AFL47953.1 hypothetical protein AVANI_40 [Mycobacterium phage Avani]AGT12142.1 hypothetical protein JABBAWOKKIE_43 [Mycobacterium phage Jabbawokkie]AHZ95496.1 hypothetical protein PBI_ZAPNER_42 [
MLGFYMAGFLGIVAVFLSDVWLDIDYRLAANWTLTLMAVLVSVFTVLYGVRSKWGTNRIGRVFFTKSVFLTVVLWQGTLSSWGGADYPYRDTIRFVIYASGVVAYAPMIITLWCEQRRDRRRRAALADA